MLGEVRENGNRPLGSEMPMRKVRKVLLRQTLRKMGATRPAYSSALRNSGKASK